MKKSWLPILICIVFVLGWEAFVIRPYNQLHKSSVPAAPNKTTPTAPATPITQNTATSASHTLAPTLAQNSAATVSLGKDRTVKIFQNGGVGAAEFSDYKVRGKKVSESVMMILDGFGWTSTDPLVQSCLSKMAKSSGEVFSATEGSATCQLSYLPDANRPGLLNAKLTLNGFAASQGFVEFRGVDSLGAGPQVDHNYLGFKIDDSKKTIREKSLKENVVKQGKVDWLAWGDKYFTAILIPNGRAGSFNPNVVYGATGYDAKKISFGFQFPLVSKEKEPTNYDFDLYFGTRDADALFRISPNLVETVDLGFFGTIARLMLTMLKILNRAFHNYGVSIIALTVLVRLAFWPLNRKVFSSGQKMKALQPEIEKIKAKYAGDKSKSQQMNLELMALYKTYKVNPLGSCLPLLLQMPIFLGLYGALNHSLDLYQAPFLGWIQDLSSPDQFYILPILWTLTLIVYTRINPTPTQPGQPDMRWMMAGMNVFFGYLSREWPSGLTLYLFVSNLVGITQQMMFQRAAKLQPIQEGA